MTLDELKIWLLNQVPTKGVVRVVVLMLDLDYPGQSSSSLMVFGPAMDDRGNARIARKLAFRALAEDDTPLMDAEGLKRVAEQVKNAKRRGEMVELPPSIVEALLAAYPGPTA